MKEHIQNILPVFAASIIALSTSSCGVEQTSEPVVIPEQEAVQANEEDAEPTGGVKHVEAAEAAKMISADNEIVVLDIRTPDEFGKGHIAGAKNIDFYADNFGEEIAKLNRETTYLVHCASGGRSGNSLEQFENLGFTSIVHLDGGFKGWEKAGNPVEK